MTFHCHYNGGFSVRACFSAAEECFGKKKQNIFKVDMCFSCTTDSFSDVEYTSLSVLQMTYIESRSQRSACGQMRTLQHGTLAPILEFLNSESGPAASSILLLMHTRRSSPVHEVFGSCQLWETFWGPGIHLGADPTTGIVNR